MTSELPSPDLSTSDYDPSSLNVQSADPCLTCVSYYHWRPQVATFATPRRSLLNVLTFSGLSADQLIAQHKACVAATKKGPYAYTKLRRVEPRPSEAFRLCMWEWIEGTLMADDPLEPRRPPPPRPPPRLDHEVATTVLIL